MNKKLKEKWTRWKPINNLSSKYYTNSISSSFNEFKILLSDIKSSKKKIKIKLKCLPESYRKINSSCNTNTACNASKKYTIADDKWTFFKIENSEYLLWLSEESCTVSKSRQLKHFVIITANSKIDIIDYDEPKVEFL